MAVVMLASQLVVNDWSYSNLGNTLPSLLLSYPFVPLNSFPDITLH